MSERNLPEGWIEAALGSLIELRYGKGLPENARCKGNVPVYGSNGVVGQHDKAVTQGPTIVVGRKGSVGEVHFSPTPCWPIDTTYFIEVFGPFKGPFLVHLLRHIGLAQHETSTAIPGLNRNETYAQVVPLPPFTEQRRIVEKVEALLAEVNAARDRLSKIPAILKRFRQAVLAAACSGRLTEEWREINQAVVNATTLYEGIQRARTEAFNEKCRLADKLGKRRPKNSDSNKKSRKEVIELPELPESWGYFRLEELSHLVTDGTHHTPCYVNTGVPFLSVKNVRPFSIRDEDVKFVDQKQHEEMNERCNPEKGDILYTKVGATFGFAARNVLDCPFSIFVSLALIKPVAPWFSSEYAEVVMNSENVFSQARDRVSGSGTPDLHLIEIRDFRIPLPPFPEQGEIVRRVRALFSFADAIEQRLAAATARAEKLPQAVLAKAFRGELVPTEAGLARAEGRDYETADQLLARIKEEKPSPTPTKSAARTRRNPEMSKKVNAGPGRGGKERGRPRKTKIQ